MRHYRSHLALIESRLDRPQTPSQMAKHHHRIPCPAPGSETELSHKRPESPLKQGSDTELSPERHNNSLSSESVLPVKQAVMAGSETEPLRT